MPVTLNNLCGDRVELQPQLPADGFFDLRIKVGECSHGSGNLSHRNVVNRLLQPAQIASCFFIPNRDL